MKRANLSRIIIAGLLMGLIIFSLSNSACSAREKNDKSEERDVWKEIWNKITSHEDVRIDVDGNIVKESMNIPTDEKEGIY